MYRREVRAVIDEGSELSSELVEVDLRARDRSVYWLPISGREQVPLSDIVGQTNSRSSPKISNRHEKGEIPELHRGEERSLRLPPPPIPPWYKLNITHQLGVFAHETPAFDKMLDRTKPLDQESVP